MKVELLIRTEQNNWQNIYVSPPGNELCRSCPNTRIYNLCRSNFEFCFVFVVFFYSAQEFSKFVFRIYTSLKSNGKWESLLFVKYPETYVCFYAKLSNRPSSFKNHSDGTKNDAEPKYINSSSVFKTIFFFFLESHLKYTLIIRNGPLVATHPKWNSMFVRFFFSISFLRSYSKSIWILRFTHSFHLRSSLNWLRYFI